MLVAPGAATAQEITLDTVIGLAGTDTLDVGIPIEFRLRVSNSSGDTYYGATNGFRVYSPNGAVWFPHIYYDTTIVQYPSVDTIVDTTYYGRWADNIYVDSMWDGGHFVNHQSDHDEDPYSVDLFGEGSDTIGFGGYQQAKWGLYDDFDEIMFTIKFDSISTASGRKTICLDSAFYRPAGYWKWSDPDTIATWDGPHCFAIKRGGLIIGGESMGFSVETQFLDCDDSDAPGAVEFEDQIEIAYSYLEQFRTKWQMHDPRSELFLQRADEDQWGMVHVRFRQCAADATVLGGALTVHLSPSDDVLHTSGQYITEIPVPKYAPMAAASAETIAETEFENENGGDAVTLEQELIWFPVDGEYTRCWRTVVVNEYPHLAMEYFVDASTGIIEQEHTAVKTGTCPDWEGNPALGTGDGHCPNSVRTNMPTYYRDSGTTSHFGFWPEAYYLGGLSSNSPYVQIQTKDWGIGLFSSSICPIWDDDNVWDDIQQRPAVDAHVGAIAYADWLHDKFGFNSYNGLGTEMDVVVNYCIGNPCVSYGPDAFWTAGQAHFAKASSNGWLTTASALDVLGHEFAHGMTGKTSLLYYGGIDGYLQESGALNEAFSDMMGAAFEIDRDDLLECCDVSWWMGEIVFPEESDSTDITCDEGLRSIEDPTLTSYPDTYGGQFWGDWDEADARHRNGTVAGKWFYLLTDGGTHNGVTVLSLGLDAASEVAFQSNAMGYWTQLSDFEDAALQSCYAALHLDEYQLNISAAQKVNRAWYAVGLMDTLDQDADGCWDGWDNCPSTANSNQADFDGDGVGDACCCSCCEGIRGDVNGDESPSPDIADVTYLVAYMIKGGPMPTCVGEANIDGDGGIDIADMTFLVSYAFKGGPAPPPAPECPPQ